MPYLLARYLFPLAKYFQTLYFSPSELLIIHSIVKCAAVIGEDGNMSALSLKT